MPLADFVPPPGEPRDPDVLLDRFLEWVISTGLELYPAQEEALLALFSGQHVILGTPTGSGKSLVALGLQFKGLCEGRTSYYTSPIKALASEKFFALCHDLGAAHVGMLTGDASINPTAPVICCTAEVLSNLALRRGEALEAPYVVMDEFHYYGDPERGVAWQIPLLLLERTQFLLMSATLGNPAFVAEDLERRTGLTVAHVTSEQRPVPLEFDWRETSLHQTLEELGEANRLPAYVVNFTQRECAELAQALTSAKLASREERERVWEAVGGFRFDSPYGKELRRFLGFGLGVHHAGLLPKYRLLVEQLSQQGLLKVICGTDTLGVGVNIPIRTVVFNKLAKYDGRKVSILSIRDFKQIAGRAGRKGFDDRGWVVAQAPESVVEARKAEASGKKKRKSSPKKGEIVWTEETFRRLVDKPPETLESKFHLTHGMVLDLLQQDAEIDDPSRRNFHALRELVRRSHEDDASKRRLIGLAARLIRSLHRTGIVRLQRDTRTDYRWVVVDEELQREFALHQALSLWLVQAIDVLDPESPEYPLELLSLVEAALEDPDVILRRQVDKAKDELVAQMKAEGVPYEERMERLEEVTHPKPAAELIYGTFATFREAHPWVSGHLVRPKSIGREMWERLDDFADFVRRYGLQRSEGVLLRYLSQLYKTLVQSVPERAKTEGVYDVEGYLRAVLEHTDTSLLEEWESLLHPELRLDPEREGAKARRALRSWELFHDPRAFAARIRAELHLLLRALADRDWETAEGAIHQDPDDPWDAQRFEEMLAPYYAEYGEIDLGPAARQAGNSLIRPLEGKRWEVRQTIVDPEGDRFWAIEGEVDLAAREDLEGPLVTVRRIGA